MKKTVLVSVFLIGGQILSAQNCSTNIIMFQSNGTCEGTTIQLIASPIVNGNSYVWSCPNAQYNSTSGPFLYIPISCMNDTGNYTLTITDSMGCVSSAIKKVNVAPKPLVYISGQAFACFGTQTSLYANDLSGTNGPYSYLWDNGVTTQFIKIKHIGGISPHPSCLITNSSGCQAYNQTAFLIGTLYPPDAFINYTGLTAFCSGGALALNATTGPQLFYQWRKSGVNINGAINAGFNATVSGNYKVIVYNSSGCSDTSEVVPVTVYPKPTATILSNGPLTFCSGDSVMLNTNLAAGYTYKWKKNGTPIPGATTPVYYAKQAGNFKVEVTNQHDCVRLSEKKTVVINCKESNVFPDMEDNLMVDLFPNPSTDQFTIRRFNAQSDNITVKLYDISGREVWASVFSAGINEIILGHQLLPGIYSAFVFSENQTKVIRVIKQ